MRTSPIALALTLAAAGLALSSSAQAAVYGASYTGFADASLLSSAISAASGSTEVQEFTVTPDDEWLLVTDDAVTASSGFPSAPLYWVNAYRDTGREIDAVAVSADGGWVVIAEDYLRRSTSGYANPSWLRDRVRAFQAAGTEIHDLTFDPDGFGWFIAAGDNGYSYSMNTDIWRAIVHARTGDRPPRQVAVNGDGDWALVAADWVATEGTSTTLRSNVARWQRQGRRIDHLGMSTAGGYLRISNGAWTPDPSDLLGQVELNVGGTDIWTRMDQLGIEGVSVGWSSGTTLQQSRGYGVLDSDEAWVGHTSRMDVASISKLTATAVALAVMSDPAVDLDLDDTIWDLATADPSPDSALEQWLDIGDWFATNGSFADFPRDMTVRQLMSHTSGLSGRADNSNDVRPLIDWSGAHRHFEGEATPSTLDQLMAGDADDSCCGWDFAEMLWVESDPGDQYSYSGGGFLLLEAVLEHATGEDFEALAEDYLFSPLGMTRSTYGGHTAEWPNGDTMQPHNADGTLMSPPLRLPVQRGGRALHHPRRPHDPAGGHHRRGPEPWRCPGHRRRPRRRDARPYHPQRRQRGHLRAGRQRELDQRRHAVPGGRRPAPGLRARRQPLPGARPGRGAPHPGRVLRPDHRGRRRGDLPHRAARSHPRRAGLGRLLIDGSWWSPGGLPAPGGRPGTPGEPGPGPGLPGGAREPARSAVSGPLGVSTMKLPLLGGWFGRSSHRGSTVEPPRSIHRWCRGRHRHRLACRIGSSGRPAPTRHRRCDFANSGSRTSGASRPSAFACPSRARRSFSA